jgi:hypothetical protein
VSALSFLIAERPEKIHTERIMLPGMTMAAKMISGMNSGPIFLPPHYFLINLLKKFHEHTFLAQYDISQRIYYIMKPVENQAVEEKNRKSTEKTLAPCVECACFDTGRFVS